MSGPYIPCSEVIEFLWSYVAGELPPAKVAEFERHLAVCPSCTAYLSTYRMTLELERGAFQPEGCEPEEELPEDLIQAVMGALRRE
ncbi:MAG TPA: zf-HC2 domain-containing protein [Thermoanaerobaculia bacterium]|nr:zf-HC2 domain-containing protein [Thermoanaerobaculia bacterium]